LFIFFLPMKEGGGRLDSGAQLAARHEASGMGCVYVPPPYPACLLFFLGCLHLSGRVAILREKN
jgi:hypothetical protein